MQCAFPGCAKEFTPYRANQKFCSDKHRKAAGNAQRAAATAAVRRADYAAAVEAAEARGADRMNGHGAGEEKPTLNLVSLGLATKPEQIRKKRVSA